MNFLLHRQKSRNHVLQMPEGLQELMGDISREVLRCQPSIDCTYKFIADYLQAMVNTRDKCKIAMEIIDDAILKTDEVYSQFAKCNFPKDKTRSFLNAMEITFRRFVDQKRKRNQDPRFIKFHADDMLDELVRKCDLTKVEVLQSRPAIQWAYRKFVKTYLSSIEGTLDTEDLYFQTEKVIASRKELEHMNANAVKIQKVFRGYQTRKSIQFQRNAHQISTDSSSSSSFREFILGKQDEVTKAAIKIQASFKGFYVRKKNILAKKKVSIRPYNPSTDGRRSTAVESFSFTLDTPKASLKWKESSTLLKVSSLIQIPRPISQEESEFTIQESRENLEDSNNDLKDLTEAAVKIQATYKGYHVRKELSSKETKSKTLPKQHSSLHLKVSLKGEEDSTPLEGSSLIEIPEPNSQEESNTKIQEPRENLEDSNIDHKDLTEAAVKIQATYKGYHVRKELSSKETKSKTLPKQLSSLHLKVSLKGEEYSTPLEGSSLIEIPKPNSQEESDTKIQEPRENLEDSNIDHKDLTEAAVKIQATYKGYHVRKELSSKETKSTTSPKQQSSLHLKVSLKGEEDSTPLEGSSLIEIPEPNSQEESDTKIEEPRENLEDSNIDHKDLTEAAVKIQATYKGYHVRKELSTKKSNSKTLQEQHSNLHPDPES
ncbi:uncharacterized protein LOC129941054 [Eupeodes corollae]|uniref:uncharacterized protein LOC129941054 n=1 Tax=Eupeodes corollae TaxID=290404 RepID=UPI0024909D79|nr:uncharacterized protein LOC129941054 [Eupeodes corollae]